MCIRDSHNSDYEVFDAVPNNVLYGIDGEMCIRDRILDTDEFTVIEKKTGKIRTIRLNPQLQHHIKEAVEVDTKDGTYHLIGDAVFLMDNLKPIPEIFYDVTPSARFVSLTDWWESVREIKRRCPDWDFILPTHEPSLVERFEKTPVLGL